MSEATLSRVETLSTAAAPPKGGTENPYLSGRREWNERYGSYIAQRDSWRLAALLSMTVSLLSVGGLAWVGSRNHLVPYVVEVDKLGSTVAVQRADLAGIPDQRIVKAQLARWVASARQVVADATAERQAIQYVYATLDRRGPALESLNELYRANSPFKRAETETVAVEIRSVLPIGDQSWRVEWDETIRGRDGRLSRTEPWQANLTVSVKPPVDEAAILMNPMGVHVSAFSWAKRI